MTTIINTSVPSLRAGPEGKQGIQGFQGISGIQGEIGEQGEKGDTGAGGGINGITSVTEAPVSEDGEGEGGPPVTTITVDVNNYGDKFIVNGTMDFDKTHVSNLRLHSADIGSEKAQSIGLSNPVKTTPRGKSLITCDVSLNFSNLNDKTYNGVRSFGWLEYLLEATAADASKVNYQNIHGTHLLGYRCGIRFTKNSDGSIKAELKERTSNNAVDIRYESSDGSNFDHAAMPFANRSTILVDATGPNDFVTYDYLRLLEKQITALTTRIDNM
nr:collagen-like protein [Moritella viscosa]SHO17792.1 Histidinol dehydrogenase [Moritella viscosa]